ncbi:hypothetical protein DAI22_01g198700 [Oryza sativa Japonica Group]|nr:hypothetical protein DAI22_01g198700 [Oryza sativa Japonica Group]
MSQASSSYGGRVKRVLCPNCGVLANRFMSTTVKNNNRVFHKCPYFAVYWGCQYYQWEDEMVDSAVHALHAPASMHAVPIQAVAPPGAFPTTLTGGNAQVDNRVMQQIKWLEKLVYVCIFLAMYAIFKK